jgi:starch phosphorylase
VTSTVVTMDRLGPSDGDGHQSEGHFRYRGQVSCDRAGRYGFTVRVVPAHVDLATPVELGLVAWA